MLQIAKLLFGLGVLKHVWLFSGSCKLVVSNVLGCFLGLLFMFNVRVEWGLKGPRLAWPFPSFPLFLFLWFCWFLLWFGGSFWKAWGQVRQHEGPNLN